MRTIRDVMHIDRANEITVTAKSTDPACPISALGLVFMPTARTPTTCSSFRAGEARDVGLFRFVREIVDILAILPQGHALIVVSAVIPIAHAMRIADEQHSDLVLNTKVNNLPGSLMTQITDTTLRATTDLILSMLQLLPSMGMFLAAALLLGKLSKLPIALPLEGADTTACNDQCVFCVGGDSRKVDFSEVYRCVIVPWSLFRLWNLDTHMQFKAIVPDQTTGTAVFRKLDWQDDGCTPLAHRQDYSSWLFADSLGRPFDRIEPLDMPGILESHLRVSLTKLACGVDIGKESACDLLDGLTMQSECSLCYPMQFIMLRPQGLRETCCLVGFHTEVPDLCCFHLSRFQTGKHHTRERIEPIDMHCLHGLSLFASLFLGHDALILSLHQTMHHDNHALIVVSGNEAKQVMRLDPNSHGLMWFFVHVGIVALYLYLSRGRGRFHLAP